MKYDPDMVRPLLGYFLVCSGAGCVFGTMYAAWFYHAGMPFWYRAMGAILLVTGIFVGWTKK